MFRNVLLLDSSMAPVKTISWKRAMVLWFQQKVAVIEEQAVEVKGDKWVFKVPSVVQLKGYVMRRLDKHVRFNRKNLFHRDDFTCQYCHVKFPPQKLTIEHVVPRCRGGKTSWTNTVSACFPCNQKKEGYTPDEAGMKLRRQPIKPQGKDFFMFWMPSDIPTEWEPYVNWTKKKIAA